MPRFIFISNNAEIASNKLICRLCAFKVLSLNEYLSSDEPPVIMHDDLCHFLFSPNNEMLSLTLNSLWGFTLESPKAVHCPVIWLHSARALGLHTSWLAVAPFRARYGNHRNFVFYAHFVFSPILALTDHRFIPLPCYHQARQNSHSENVFCILATGQCDTTASVVCFLYKNARDCGD